MTTLTIRIREDLKDNLDNAALRAGFSRIKEGELSGNISTLLHLLAQSLPTKSDEEIRRFIMDRGE